jgi:hypothetical protein
MQIVAVPYKTMNQIEDLTLTLNGMSLHHHQKNLQ